MNRIDKTLFFILLVFAFNLQAQTITFYVDPNTGDDSNSGTINQPFKTISKGLSALGAKGTLFLRNGIYPSPSKLNLNKTGQPDNYIKIWAYSGERPIVDFTGNGTSDGFSISGSYYHLVGIEVKNAGHNGFNISGNNNIIENCIAHDNKNTGIHLTGSSSPGPSNNLILNCDSFYNFDPPIGGNADGFSAKWTVGPNNIFRGCRSYNNSDDGWDLWMCTTTITIDSCYAFRNGVDIWNTGQFDGNGNGFKLGGNNVATPHIIKNCIAFDNAGNGGKGFDENNNTAGQTVYNCTAFRNKNKNYSFTNTLVQGQHIFKNNISFQGSVNISSAIQEKNNWQGFNTTTADFISIDTTGIVSRRNENGRLTRSNFFRLTAGSSLIDAGVNVGIPFAGIAPDLGAFETGMEMPSDVRPERNIPSEFSIFNNYPNPFNPETAIQYIIPSPGPVSVRIYDIEGRLVNELSGGYAEAGFHKVAWNGLNQTGAGAASGIYLCVVEFKNMIRSLKLVLMK